MLLKRCSLKRKGTKSIGRIDHSLFVFMHVHIIKKKGPQLNGCTKKGALKGKNAEKRGGICVVEFAGLCL